MAGSNTVVVTPDYLAGEVIQACEPAVAHLVLLQDNACLAAAGVVIGSSDPTTVASGNNVTFRIDGAFAEVDATDDLWVLTGAPYGSNGTAATTLLTSSGVNVTADDTVTIGSVTYTFKDTVSTTANEVLDDTNAATTLQNLHDAINLTGDGSGYGSATVLNPDVAAGTVTATTLPLTARAQGLAGNALASTTTAATLSFPHATLTGGVDPTRTPVNQWLLCLIADGTASVVAGTVAATAAAVTFPDVVGADGYTYPAPGPSVAIIGQLTVEATSGTFTPGTTPLDDANLTVTYRDGYEATASGCPIPMPRL